jgi:outer membrane protein assembly factor BamB
MKTIFTGLFLILIIGTNLSKAQQLEKVWETTCDLQTPESVLYDTDDNVIYVANINGNPTEKDGNGFISILNTDGSEKKLKWITGLNAPKGMAVFNGKLYVADIDELVEININKGEISAKYEAPGALFLNDVTACMDGKLFVSDMQTAKIHVLNENKFTVWAEGAPMESPNGLMAEKGKLYVGDKNIYEYDIKTGESKMLVENAGGVDGLEKNKDGDFVFSNWQGRIFIHKNGKTIKLLDTTEKKINSADIDYSMKLELVLVPTFFDNKVVAYKIVE